MADIITSEIAAIRTTIPKIKELSDEFLFSLICYKYFYNDGRLDYKDYADCYVDGRNDGGIDIITLGEDDHQDKIILVQSKYVTEISNKQDIVDIFTKMEQTCKDFINYRYAQYNPRLKRIFKEKPSIVEDQAPVFELVLFTSFQPTDKRKEEISHEIETVESLSNFQITIIYKDEIIEQIRSSVDSQPFVKEGKIKIAKEDGYLKYGKNGLLVNISANSLRDLYDRYALTGLFEQNFRYFLRNKRIDDSIKESLRNKRDEFWFLNNGIIIGCKDFRLDGDNVKLYDFSIVNGCQTTTLIGEFKEKGQEKDFYLPCKIVKPNEEKSFDPFIAAIGEASNSQKPISDRDLKSNKREQRNLQKHLREETPEIYLEIKRGEQLLTPTKKKLLEPWQYVKNDMYGQLVLSFHIQLPGTARNGKRKLFADNNLYNKIFRRLYDKPGIIDLLKINSFYDEFLNNDDFFTDPVQESVAANGRFVTIAILGFMLKVKHKKIDVKKISKDEEWESHITEDNLSGNIFANKLPDDFKSYLFGLFSDITVELKDLYEKREAEETAISNFFKTDTKYRSVILKQIIARFYNNPMRAKDLQKYLSIFA